MYINMSVDYSQLYNNLRINSVHFNGIDGLDRFTRIFREQIKCLLKTQYRTRVLNMMLDIMM